MKHDHSAFDSETGFGLEPSFDPRAFVSEDALRAASVNAFPIVARHTTARDRAGPAMGVICALMLGGATFWSMTSHRSSAPAHPKALASDVADGSSKEASPRLQPANASAPDLAEGAQPPIVAPLPTTAAMMPAEEPMAAAPADAKPVVDAANLATTRHSWAPMLVIDGGNPVAEAAAATTSKDAAAVADTPTATRMSDPARTVTQGTLIPAVLETAIDSDLPGYARAVVTRDVYSFDRSQVLIPRSSRLIGEYKSGLADGQKRVYVTWTRLIRPDGVSIAIASPATSPSGGTGLSGQVNGHFMQRFGSAILLTVVGAASAVGSSGLVLAGSQSAASVAASHGAQIPPTVRVQPGQPLRVFTAHDLDFASIASASVQ